MPLVAGRRTTVRVHIDVDPGFAFVDGALLIERAGQADVVLIPTTGRSHHRGAHRHRFGAQLRASSRPTTPPGR